MNRSKIRAAFIVVAALLGGLLSVAPSYALSGPAQHRAIGGYLTYAAAHHLPLRGESRPNVPMGGTGCSGLCGYEFSDAFVGVTGTETSASVKVTVNQQGLEESTDHAWLGNNHSLANLVIAGTCDSGNPNCSSQNPLIEIQLMDSQSFCNGSFKPCFVVESWLNGTDEFSGGYLSAGGTYGEPNDGSWHPGTIGGTITLGYHLGTGFIFITVNGQDVGEIPYMFWGQNHWGAVTEESVQSEVLNTNGNFGTEPMPSMNYTFSNFTDSNGGTLPAPAVSSDYTVSSHSSTGWTVSGGRAPSNTSTSWPIELSQDDSNSSFAGYCITDSGGTKSNGNPIVIGDCTSWNADQTWRYDPTSEEIWYQGGGTGGWCLDDPSNSTTNNTQLILEACSGLTGEKWTPSAISGSRDYIQWNAANGVVCINNPTNSTTVGDPIEIYACNGTKAQSEDNFNF